MDKNKPLLRQPNWLLWIPLLISAVVLGAYVWNFIQQPLSDDAGQWGTFGDYFGGLLNPVIAACTLFVAMRVWQLQKVELKSTQEALQEQAKTAEQQRGEQRFFDLLTLHHRTLDSMSFQGNNGLDALNDFLKTRELLIELFLKKGLAPYERKTDPNDGTKYLATNSPFSDTKDLTTPTVQDVRSEWSKQDDKVFLYPYFRMVYRLLSDAPSLLGERECFRYIKLFRAQLTDAELTLLGLNLLLSDSGQNLHEAAEKYGLLKHLPKSPFRCVLEKELNRSVFGRKFAQEHPFPHMESC